MPNISDYYPLMEKGFTTRATSYNGLLSMSDCRLFPKLGEDASAPASPNGSPDRRPFQEVAASAAARREVRVGIIFPAHLIEQPAEHLQVTAQRMGAQTVHWVEETITQSVFDSLITDRNIFPNGQPADPIKLHTTKRYMPFAKMYERFDDAEDGIANTWIMTGKTWAMCKALYPRHATDRKREGKWLFGERVAVVEFNDYEHGILYGIFNPGLTVKITDVAIGPFLGYPDEVKLSIGGEWAVSDKNLFWCWE